MHMDVEKRLRKILWLGCATGTVRRRGASALARSKWPGRRPLAAWSCARRQSEQGLGVFIGEERAQERARISSSRGLRPWRLREHMHAVIPSGVARGWGRWGSGPTGLWRWRGSEREATGGRATRGCQKHGWSRAKWLSGPARTVCESVCFSFLFFNREQKWP